MVKAQAVEPEPGIGDLLPGAQFMDAFRITVADGGGLDAREAARLAFAKPPAWIGRLLALRNLIVAPLGLKTGRETDDSAEKIGMFPLLSVTPARAVLGFDDFHLDFRVVVDVLTERAESRVTVATLVRRHNLLGRAYLAAILPFHRLVVRAMLESMARDVRDGRSSLR